MLNLYTYCCIFFLNSLARLLLAVVQEGDQEKMKSCSEGETEKLIGCAHLAERYTSMI